MVRILKRPMFRRGGMPKNQGITAVRSEYMGGGMTGIMSGIIPRPDAGLTPRIGYQTGTPPAGTVLGQNFRMTPSGSSPIGTASRFFPPTVVPQEPPRSVPRMEQLGRSFRNLLTRGAGIPGALTTAGLAAGSVSGPAILAYLNRPTTKEELKVMKEMGPLDETLMEEDYIEYEKARTEARKNGTPLQKKDYFKDPEELQEDIDKAKLKKEDDNSLLDTTGGEKNIKDEESALMKAYKEYAPIFEKELGVSPEDTKKQLYLQLAKFGAGVAAQPGGDLVGAIGKAAMPAIEGAGATIKDQSSAKRQAKLLALQTAISEGKPGPIATGINDIAKIYGVSKKEAAAIYEKWNARTAVGQAERTKRLTEFAEKRLNVNPEGFSMNIEKLLKDPELKDLVGEFNKKLPTDKNGAPDPDEMVDKEYYVGENGRLYRVDKSVEPPRLLEPGDKGFKDSKKKSSTNKK